MPNVEDICLQSPSQLRGDRKSDVRLVWKCFHSALQQEFLAIVEHQEQRNRIRKPNACGIGLSGESPLLPFQGRLQPAPNLVFPQLLGPPPQHELLRTDLWMDTILCLYSFFFAHDALCLVDIKLIPKTQPEGPLCLLSSSRGPGEKEVSSNVLNCDMNTCAPQIHMLKP